MRDAVFIAANAHKLFDIAIPGRNVFVADGPVYADAFFCVGFKIEVAPALRPPCPHQRFASGLVTPDPVERFCLFVRMFVVFYKKVLCGFGKRITLAHYRVFFFYRLG